MIHNKPEKSEVISEGSLSWGGFFHTSFWIDPSNDLIAISMAQKYPVPESDIHSKFQALVYQAILEP